jgi:YHS domain-containing protein
MATVTDPVCGMTFDSSQAEAQSTYQGQAYFFCSQECRKLFDENPDQYLQGQRQPETTTDEPIPL